MPSRLTRSCPGCAISAGTARSTMLADRDAVERDGGRAGAAVRGVDLHVVGQQFERQAGGLGGILGQHHRARAGVEHHRHPRAVDLRRHLEVAGAAAHDLHGALAALRGRGPASARPSPGRRCRAAPPGRCSRPPARARPRPRTAPPPAPSTAFRGTAPARRRRSAPPARRDRRASRGRRSTGLRSCLVWPFRATITTRTSARPISRIQSRRRGTANGLTDARRRASAP